MASRKKSRADGNIEAGSNCLVKSAFYFTSQHNIAAAAAAGCDVGSISEGKVNRETL